MNLKKESILLIEQDVEASDELASYLKSQGYIVETAQDGKTALGGLADDKSRFGCIVTELQFADMDGMTLITQIREHVNIPVIVASERTETTTKVIVLELGADDYLEKPFDRHELTARIKSAIRRYNEVSQDVVQQIEEKIEQHLVSTQQSDLIYEFGEWCFLPQKFCLKHKNGSVTELTTAEFELLKVLVSHPHKVMTRDALFDLLKHDNYENYDRSVDVQISRIRKKLGDKPRAQKFIKTIHGTGYMFNSDVKIIETDET